MAGTLLYLTELSGLKVFDMKGRRLGNIREAALVPLIHHSRIDRFFVGGGWAWLSIRHDQIQSISLDGIHLRDEQLTPFHSEEYMLRMRRDLLDQQIIDVHGRKVVRVTDVTFEIRHGDDHDELYVQEVDIGVRSMFRRILEGVVPSRWVRRMQSRIPPNSIPWDMCNIVEHDPQRRLRLNISTRVLEQMHPADLADIVEELSPEDREAIFEHMDSEAAADALSEVDPDIQASILESLDSGVAADILEEMSPDEAADALAELGDETSEGILREMETEPKSEVRELLEFEEDTAGGLMNTEYVAVHGNATVEDAMGALRANEELLESLNTIVLLDEDEKLAGMVPLARVLIAPAGARLRELSIETMIQVGVDETQERVSELFDKYNLLTLPVVDDEGKLAGVITADDIITVLRRK